MKRLKRSANNPGAGWRPSASHLQYAVMVVASLLLVLLLPDPATRAILPPLIYGQTAVVGLYTCTRPLLTAGLPARGFGPLLARLGVVALAVAFAAGVVVALSGVRQSTPVVVLLALVATGLFAGVGIAIASAAPSLTWFRAVSGGAFFVAALPLAGYLGVFEHVGLLYIPGGGPFALLSLALARPLEWAVFRTAWISSILYAGAGLATGAAVFAVRARSIRNAGSRESRESRKGLRQ
ncbi:MAG: hypothetical protein ACOC0B_01595 [bacterium]